MQQPPHTIIEIAMQVIIPDSTPELIYPLTRNIATASAHINRHWKRVFLECQGRTMPLQAAWLATIVIQRDGILSETSTD
jgi:hypothetical protein